MNPWDFDVDDVADDAMRHAAAIVQSMRHDGGDVGVRLSLDLDKVQMLAVIGALASIASAFYDTVDALGGAGSADAMIQRDILDMERRAIARKEGR